MSFCKVKRTVSIKRTVCNNLSISKQKSIIYMHSGRKKIINLWLCIQEGKKDFEVSKIDLNLHMHPGKEIEQKGARRAPTNPWVYIVWVKRTVSIQGEYSPCSIKRTVCKKVHISLLNVPYDPRIGTIIKLNVPYL